MKEETAIVTVPEVPATTIAVNAVYLERIRKFETLVLQYPKLTSNDDCAAVNQLDTEASRLAKEIEVKRQEAKEPFLTIGRRIDEACKPLIARLKDVTLMTGARLFEYRREMERIAAEHQRKQDEERRAQEEAQRKIEREAEIARRKNAAPVIVPPKPTPVVQTVIEVPVIAVKTRKVTKCRVFDHAQIPIFVRTEAGSIMLRPVDEAAVKNALTSGINVPGAELYEEETVVRR